MPKIVDYDVKKREIVIQAMQIFICKGYHDTNFKDISKSCGMGRTSIYQYFKNKDEIFQYAIIYITDLIKNDLKSILEIEEMSNLEKINMVLVELVTEYKNRSMMLVITDLWLLINRESGHEFDGAYICIKEIRKIFKYLIEEGIKEKEIRPIDSEKMSVVLYSFLDSFLLHSSLVNNEDLQEYLQTVNLLIDGLKV